LDESLSAGLKGKKINFGENVGYLQFSFQLCTWLLIFMHDLRDIVAFTLLTFSLGVSTEAKEEGRPSEFTLIG